VECPGFCKRIHEKDGPKQLAGKTGKIALNVGSEGMEVERVRIRRIHRCCTQLPIRHKPHSSRHIAECCHERINRFRRSNYESLGIIPERKLDETRNIVRDSQQVGDETDNGTKGGRRHLLCPAVPLATAAILHPLEDEPDSRTKPIERAFQLFEYLDSAAEVALSDAKPFECGLHSGGTVDQVVSLDAEMPKTIASAHQSGLDIRIRARKAIEGIGKRSPPGRRLFDVRAFAGVFLLKAFHLGKTGGCCGPGRGSLAD
jgi:hypothetical protein